MCQEVFGLEIVGTAPGEDIEDAGVADMTPGSGKDATLYSV